MKLEKKMKTLRLYKEHVTARDIGEALSVLGKRLKWLLLSADIECLEAAVYAISMWIGWRVLFPGTPILQSPNWLVINNLIIKGHGCQILGTVSFVGALFGMVGLIEDTTRPRRVGVNCCLL